MTEEEKILFSLNRPTLNPSQSPNWTCSRSRWSSRPRRSWRRRGLCRLGPGQPDRGLGRGVLALGPGLGLRLVLLALLALGRVHPQPPPLRPAARPRAAGPSAAGASRAPRREPGLRHGPPLSASVLTSSDLPCPPLPSLGPPSFAELKGG
eukprot:9495131-Pyramimonas_sp.AAC.1